MTYNAGALNQEQIEIFKAFWENFKHILSLEISDIQKNFIIQEELLKIMVYNLPNLNASFYCISEIQSYTFNALFEQRLFKEISAEIFDNYEQFQKFMYKAIQIYSEIFDVDLIDNIKNSRTSWQGSGFENFTDDFFK